MRKRYLQIARAIAPFIIILGSFLLGLAWLAAPVRVAVLERAAQLQLLAATIGLNDPHDDVAAQACINLLDSESPQHHDDLLEILEARPDAAMRCFNALDARHTPLAAEDDATHPDSPSHSTLVPHYQIAAHTLGKRWIRALQNGDSEQCENAQHARDSMEVSRQDPTANLLTCALSSSSLHNRQCCVDALGGAPAVARLLEQPERYSPPRGLHTYQELFETAFPLNDAEDAAETTPADISQQTIQDWVVRVGCDLHLRAPHRTDIIATFAPLIESPHCAPPADNPLKQGFYRPENWAATCHHHYDYHRVAQAKPPTQALCDALESASTHRAIEQADFTLFAALDASSRLPAVERLRPGYPLLEIAPARVGKRSRAIKKNYRGASNQNAPVLSAFFHGLISH